MTVEELKEKISEISNSEFPLIDFFNDIGWLEGSKWFNTEKAYEDIEKIYNVFMFYINKCKKLEKELKQTKLNFKNSQTHSKNCYKKLKEKYEKLERAYKNNEVLARDLNELINRNLELKKDYELLDEDYDQLFAKFLKSEKENQELKASYESLKKDYWELDKVENDILQKFLLQGQVISAIQDEIVKKIETETIYEDVSPLCEVTISINKKIFDMLFEKKEVLEDE